MSNLLTCKEVALRLRVSESTVWDYTRTGRLPYVALGKEKRIIEDDLEQFILSNRKVGTEATEEES